MEIRQLVAAARANDQRAWAQLSSRLYPRLRAWFASKFSGCDSDVLVQDTLFVLWRKLPTIELRSEAEFMRWTYRIAAFSALAALRQMKRDEALIERLDMLVRTPSPQVITQLARSERIEMVMREIDKLPGAERRAAENMLDGGTARDLAAQVDIEWSSARSLETRVRRRLRERLRESTPPP